MRKLDNPKYKKLVLEEEKVHNQLDFIESLYSNNEKILKPSTIEIAKNQKEKLGSLKKLFNKLNDVVTYHSFELIFLALFLILSIIMFFIAPFWLNLMLIIILFSFIIKLIFSSSYTYSEKIKENDWRYDSYRLLNNMKNPEACPQYKVNNKAYPETIYISIESKYKSFYFPFNKTYYNLIHDEIYESTLKEEFKKTDKEIGEEKNLLKKFSKLEEEQALEYALELKEIVNKLNIKSRQKFLKEKKESLQYQIEAVKEKQEQVLGRDIESTRAISSRIDKEMKKVS